MSVWRSLRLGLWSLLHKDVVARELDDELRHYLSLATQENVRKGMSPEAAARAALLAMGGIEPTKTQVRTGGWEAAVDGWLQDVRIAVRGLQRSPGFTYVALASLTLGIAINTTMFSVVNAVIFRPLPYRDAGRLALIWTDDNRRGLHREETAYLTITDWRTQSRAFQDIAYFTTQRVAPMANDPSRGRGRSRTALVSSNLFSVLGVLPLHGRLITAEDERQRAPVAVISYQFWQRWFDGAPNVVGRMITVDDASKGGLGSLIIIGVLPSGFYFPDKQTEIFTPATTYWRFTRETTERFHDWARRWVAVGRLAPHASMAEARADLARIGKQLALTHTTSIADFPGFGTTVLPVLDSIAGPNLQSALWMLLGAVGIVLLVVCANVANLQLARGATRQREFAVRRALGATRGRLVLQLMVESGVLVVIGGLAGIGLATWTTKVVATLASAYVPRLDDVAWDGRVLLFAVAIAMASGVIFGLVPVLRLSATDASEAIREGGRGTASARVHRSQSVLVLAQCALALVLLTGAGLLLKSLHRLTSVNPGFDSQRVLVMRLEFPSDPPPTAAQRTQTSLTESASARAREQTVAALDDRLRTIQGVEAVGFVDDMFIAGQGTRSITIPGRTMDQISAGELNDGAVTPGFFTVMRVPLRRGRYPTRYDAQQKIRALWSLVVTDLSLAEKERRAIPEPVVVNEAFARRFFAGDDPVGKRFCIDPTTKTYWYEIVGVVGDMHRQGLDRAAIPEYYGPYIPSSNGRVDLLVRTAREPLTLASTIRREVVRALPSVVVASVSTAETQLADFSSQRRLETWLLASFAALAVALAGIGIFGLAQYRVAERTREIGVRIALGATPRDVVRLVIAQGMRMPVAGIAIGLLASAGLTRLIAHQLYDVTPEDPITYGSVAVLLVLVSATACYLPARRAARADPVQALRQA